MHLGHGEIELAFFTMTRRLRSELVRILVDEIRISEVETTVPQCPLTLRFIPRVPHNYIVSTK